MKFNNQTHFSHPPVNRAEQCAPQVVDIDALSKRQPAGIAAVAAAARMKKHKTGAAAARKKRSLDEVDAATQQAVQLLSVTPLAGPAGGELPFHACVFYVRK